MPILVLTFGGSLVALHSASVYVMQFQKGICFFFWLDLHTLLFFSAEYATCTTSRTCVLVTLQGYHISSRMGFDLMGGSGGNSLHWARLPQYTRLCCISTVIYYLPRVADRLGLLQARIP